MIFLFLHFIHVTLNLNPLELSRTCSMSLCLYLSMSFSLQHAKLSYQNLKNAFLHCCWLLLEIGNIELFMIMQSWIYFSIQIIRKIHTFWIVHNEYKILWYAIKSTATPDCLSIDRKISFGYGLRHLLGLVVLKWNLVQ